MLRFGMVVLGAQSILGVMVRYGYSVFAVAWC